MNQDHVLPYLGAVLINTGRALRELYRYQDGDPDALYRARAHIVWAIDRAQMALASMTEGSTKDKKTALG